MGNRASRFERRAAERRSARATIFRMFIPLIPDVAIRLGDRARCKGVSLTTYAQAVFMEHLGETNLTQQNAETIQRVVRTGKR